MARIALVNPQVARGWGIGLAPSAWEDVVPRHGLCFLSAALKRAGHRVDAVDLRVLGGWDDYGRLLARLSPDVVGVTAHTMEASAARECLRRAKEALPACRTVAGGIHFTMRPEEAGDAADVVLRGEGERAFVDLLASPEGIPRVFWADPPDLDLLPPEDRDLFPGAEWRTRFPLWDLRTPTVEVLTGRGCPFTCRFCCGPGEQNLFSRPSAADPERRVPSLRRRSVANVLEELDGLRRRFRFRSIVFHDDQFLLAPAWTEALCEGLHRNGFASGGVAWWASCRADLICRHPRTIGAMARAGLRIVSIGFESFSDPMLEWLGKGTTRAQNLEAARICRRLGLAVYANVMFGVPGPDGRWSLEDDLASLAALDEVRPRYFSPSFFSPVPGSWMHDWAAARGLGGAGATDRAGHRRPSDGRVAGVDWAHLEELVGAASRRYARPWYDRARLRRFRMRRNPLAAPRGEHPGSAR